MSQQALRNGAESQMDINYGYSLIPSDLLGEIKDSLIAEQRRLCAYTGIGINAEHSHIEHLLPQKHCQRGQEDVSYANMVACYPGTKDKYVPFGALVKANWPSRAEQHLFVSPRSAGCEARFLFRRRSKITSAIPSGTYFPHISSALSQTLFRPRTTSAADQY